MTSPRNVARAALLHLALLLALERWPEARAILAGDVDQDDFDGRGIA